MRIPAAVVLLITLAPLRAQEMKLPMWMLEAFAGERSAAADSALEARIYAGLGLDSLRANRFIGSYKGTMSMAGGENMRFSFSSWTDTTKGSVSMTISGEGKEVTLTYLADLPTNTAILAASGNGEKSASMSSLRDMLFMNAMMRGALEPTKVTPTRRTRKVAGITCKEHYQLEGRDTVRVWTSNIARSPFVDAWNWMPMGGETPFMTFGLLGAIGDPMPLRLVNDDLTIEITEVKQGRQPQPAFDLSAYTVTDKRKPNDRNAPVTNTPPRTLPLGSSGAQGNGTGGGKVEEEEFTLVPMAPQVVAEPPPPPVPPVAAAPPTTVDAATYSGPAWFTVDVKGRTLITQPLAPKDVKKNCEVAMVVSVDAYGNVNPQRINEEKTFFATQEMKDLAWQLTVRMKFAPVPEGSRGTPEGLITFKFHRGM